MRLRLRKSRLIESAGSALMVPAKLEAMGGDSRGLRSALDCDGADEGFTVVTDPARDGDQGHMYAGVKYFAMTFRRGAGWALWQPGLRRELAAA